MVVDRHLWRLAQRISAVDGPAADKGPIEGHDGDLPFQHGKSGGLAAFFGAVPGVLLDGHRARSSLKRDANNDGDPFVTRSAKTARPPFRQGIRPQHIVSAAVLQGDQEPVQKGP